MASVVESLEQALELQDTPTISTSSGDATGVGQAFEEGIIQPLQSSQGQVATILEESFVSQSKEEITRRKDLSRGKVWKPLCCWPWKAIWKRGKKQRAEVSFPEELPMPNLPLYGYESLTNATNNFHPDNQLGGYLSRVYLSRVYKGILLNGQEIAVKRPSNFSQMANKEIMDEAVVISKLQHHNLVKLLGCCVEVIQKLLIYEYIPNGSLDAYLFDPKKRDLLDWNKRTIIIEGIARGLLYLHRDSRLNVIIHRNLTASNILLDKELNPKISGFSSARILEEISSARILDGINYDYTSRLEGKYGYMAPEYFLEGLFSEKSDVYSFGVLLLEIISGKSNTEFYNDLNYKSLIGWAWILWNENETIKLVDQAILCPGIEMEILRYVHVGLLCVEESAMDRPDVPTLLSMLKSGIPELPKPKLPAFNERLGLSDSESLVWRFCEGLNAVIPRYFMTQF